MSTTVSLNGSNYSIPRTGDDSWSNTGGVDDFLVALSTGVLQKAGGAFTLTAEVNFGGSFGLKSLYYKSTGANPATAGVVRLANAESLKWRNAANSADLDLTVDASNNLNFNGAPIVTLSLGSANTALVMNSGGTGYQWAQIANANVSSSAAIAYSKLALTGSLVNADVASGAAIAYSKLALTASVVNADIATGAAIAYSKLALTGSIVNADVSSSAAIAYSKLSLATSIVNGDISASAAIAYSKLALTGAVVNADISASAAIAYSKLSLTGSIVNADVSASAAIAGTKISPNFGSQAVSTTGSVSGATKAITGTGGAGYMDVAEQSAAPSAPASSTLRVYAKTDDKLYLQNSAGVETAVGAGAGEKNYISGSSTASGWTASGAGITVATDTTAAELPRPNTTATGIKITGVSGSTAYAYYRFILDDADANKKLKVQFDLKPVSGYASNDFKVDVYSNTASDYTTGNTRLLLSTDSSSVTGIPALTGTFRTTFDAPATSAKWIEVRIGLNGTNTHACVFSDIIVGPGVVTQGAGISEAASYTPTITGVGTATAVNFWYRRVGSWYQIWGSFTTGTVTATNLSLTLPNGHTIDSTKVTSDNTVFGVGTSTNGVAQGALNDGDAVLAFPDSGDYTKIYLTYKQSGTAPNALVPIAANSFMGSSKQLTIGSMWVPVAELAGSGTVNVAQNDVEYVYNSSGITAAGTSDTTSFAYGPSGVAWGAIVSTSAGNTTTMRVRFRTPISSTDKLELETDWGTLGAQWVPWIFPYTSQGTSTYGARLKIVNSTDVDVQFGNNGVFATNATFGGNGDTWTSIGTWRWRVKKSTGGQAVGFGIVSGTASGLLPSTNTSLDDASATRLGLKQYVGGTTYNGVALTVTGPTSWTAARAVFVPYQMNDGTWRCRFNLYGTGMSGTGTQDFTVAGLIPKSTSSFQQPVTVTGSSNSSAIAYTVPSGTTDPGTIRTSLTYTATTLGVSGDIELNSKPTWAY